MSRDPNFSNARARFAAFHQYSRLLFSIAYRMLGSTADAEDMLQETFIRWQEAPNEEIRSPKAFLVAIVRRLCINYLQSARVRRELYIGRSFPERSIRDTGTNPLAPVRAGKSLSAALLIILERLTPIERAVFLLREVFQYEYPALARMLGVNEVHCRQILRRARQHLADDSHRRFTPSAEKQNELLEQFAKAADNGDIDGLLTLLSRDAAAFRDHGRTPLEARVSAALGPFSQRFDYGLL